MSPGDSSAKWRDKHDRSFYYIDCRERTSLQESTFNRVWDLRSAESPWVCGIIGPPFSGKGIFAQMLLEKVKARSPYCNVRPFNCNDYAADIDRILNEVVEISDYQKGMSDLAKGLIEETGKPGKDDIAYILKGEYDPTLTYQLIKALINAGYRNILYTSNLRVKGRWSSREEEGVFDVESVVAMLGPLTADESYSMLHRISAQFANSGITLEEYRSLRTINDLCDPALLTLINRYIIESHRQFTKEELEDVLENWRPLTNPLLDRADSALEYRRESIGRWKDDRLDKEWAESGLSGDFRKAIPLVERFLAFNDNAMSVRQSILKDFLLANFPSETKPMDDAKLNAAVVHLIEFMRDHSLALYEEFWHECDECGLRLSSVISACIRRKMEYEPASWKSGLESICKAVLFMSLNERSRIADIRMHLNIVDSMIRFDTLNRDSSDGPFCGRGSVRAALSDLMRHYVDNNLFDVHLFDSVRCLSNYLEYLSEITDPREWELSREIMVLMADMMTDVDCGSYERDHFVYLTHFLNDDTFEPPSGVSEKDAECLRMLCAVARINLMSKRPRLLQRKPDESNVLDREYEHLNDRLMEMKSEDSRWYRMAVCLYIRWGEHYLDRKPLRTETLFEIVRNLYESTSKTDVASNLNGHYYTSCLKYPFNLAMARMHLMNVLQISNPAGFADAQPTEVLIANFNEMESEERGETEDPGRFNKARSICLYLISDSKCGVREKIMSLILLADVEIRSDNQMEAKYYLDTAYREIYLFRFQKENLLARFEEKCGDFDRRFGNLVSAKTRYLNALGYYSGLGKFWLRAVVATKIFSVNCALNNNDARNRALLDEVLTFCNSELGKEYVHAHISILRSLGSGQ